MSKRLSVIGGCTLFWMVVGAAVADNRCELTVNQMIMAGNECQQFVRQFGSQMRTGEACEAMESWRRVAERRNCQRGQLPRGQQQELAWLEGHLSDISGGRRVWLLQ